MSRGWALGPPEAAAGAEAAAWPGGAAAAAPAPAACSQLYQVCTPPAYRARQIPTAALLIYMYNAEVRRAASSKAA